MNNCLTRGKTQKFHTNLDYKLYSKIPKDNYEDEALFGHQLIEVHLMLHILSIMSSSSSRSCFQIKQGCKYQILNTAEVLTFKTLSISNIPFFNSPSSTTGPWLYWSKSFHSASHSLPQYPHIWQREIAATHLLPSHLQPNIVDLWWGNHTILHDPEVHHQVILFFHLHGEKFP